MLAVFREHHLEDGGAPLRSDRKAEVSEGQNHNDGTLDPGIDGVQHVDGEGQVRGRSVLQGSRDYEEVRPPSGPNREASGDPEENREGA